MKLSSLVKSRTQLDSVSPAVYEDYLISELNGLVDLFTSNGLATNELKHGLKKENESIRNSFARIRNELQDFRNYIEHHITRLEKEYYPLSETIYHQSLDDSAEYILQRCADSQTFINVEVTELFLSRVGLYNNWKYPGMQIRPFDGKFTEVIKACDPLYLVDTDDNLFQEVKKNWSPQYQNRICYYTINDKASAPLKELPTGQFGFILAVDFFNFKSLTAIDRYLQEFWKKLRPGGVAMFTYNNCDLPYGVKNVENKFACYTPATAIINHAEEIGFQILKEFNPIEHASWLEIKKPGELTSIRGGQTLAEIHKFD